MDELAASDDRLASSVRVGRMRGKLAAAVKFRAPANIQLRRAQLILMLATLVPTILMTLLGIVLLAVGSPSVRIIAGTLMLAFCTTAITGYILGSIFVSRGASMARVQTDFLSSVSHELRTPLTSIRLFIETLRSDRLTDDDDRRQCLALLEREVQRLEGLVQRLIELSRMQAGKHQFARDPIRVGDILTDAIESFDAATLSDPTPIEVDRGVADEAWVLGDRIALARAISNLLINAWKYTPEDDKQIHLAVEPIGKRKLAITVADNGLGITRSEQRHIFDTFERGKHAIARRIDGVGLGLAAVRAIVRVHKGQVELTSKPGRGSEFRIVLRRLEAQPGPST